MIIIVNYYPKNNLGIIIIINKTEMKQTTILINLEGAFDLKIL